MTRVLQLCKRLQSRPDPPRRAGVRLRHFQGRADVDLWLDLHRRAFADKPNRARPWSGRDFRREFLDKWWWQAERMWFAQFTCHGASQSRLVGTVALGQRGPPADSRPVVFWLAVLPGWRRRGVGRLLMSAVEAACWERGHRRLWLETHSGWTAAAAFYRELGYREPRDAP